MAVETKKMANLAAAGGNFGDQIKPWPDRIKTFYNDVRSEMRKVTSPSWKEVQATTTVVVITVFIFAAYFAVIDYFIQNGVTYLFNYFKAHLSRSDSRFEFKIRWTKAGRPEQHRPGRSPMMLDEEKNEAA